MVRLECIACGEGYRVGDADVAAAARLGTCPHCTRTPASQSGGPRTTPQRRATSSATDEDDAQPIRRLTRRSPRPRSQVILTVALMFVSLGGLFLCVMSARALTNLVLMVASQFALVGIFALALIPSVAAVALGLFMIRLVFGLQATSLPSLDDLDTSERTTRPTTKRDGPADHSRDTVEAIARRQAAANQQRRTMQYGYYLMCQQKAKPRPR